MSLYNYKNSKAIRISQIVLGVIAIALSVAVIAFPVFTSILLVTLLSLGLLFLGIARIIQGVSNKDISKWSRAFIISVGILSLVISLIVIAHPISGVILLTFLLAINL